MKVHIGDSKGENLGSRKLNSVSIAKPMLRNGMKLPWLVWLSGLSASLQTQGSPV